jgi:hypothetical protein
VGSRPSSVGECGMMGSRESGVGSRESAVGKCGIIDFDFIIPMQPETI